MYFLHFFFSELFRLFPTPGVRRLFSPLHAFSYPVFADIKNAVSNRQGSAAVRISKAMPCR